MLSVKERAGVEPRTSYSAAEAPLQPSPPPGYVAVESRSTGRPETSLRFYLRGNVRLSIKYATITDTVLYGDSRAVLISASTVVELQGRGLDQILDRIDEERAFKVHEFDSSRYPLPTGDSEPFVMKVQTHRLRGAEYLGSLPGADSVQERGPAAGASLDDCPMPLHGHSN